MSKLQKEDYLYASSCIKNAEKALFTKNALEKMVEAKSVDEVLKVLYEHSFGGAEALDSVYDYEEMLLEEERRLVRYVRSVAPKPEIFDIFSYLFDYHNLKVLLKAENTGENPAEYLIDAGTIEASRLENLVRNREFIPFTLNMKNGFLEAQDAFSKSSDPQIIDLILDKYYFQDVTETAYKEDEKFLTKYVKALIDCANIRTFTRLKRMGKPWDFFVKVFIPGGSIPERVFIPNYDMPLDQFAEVLAPYGFSEVIAKGAEALKATGKITELEKQCDNFLMRVVGEAKYISYGLETLIGYIVAKGQDIKLARIILSGKLAELSPEEIKERLRETYV